MRKILLILLGYFLAVLPRVQAHTDEEPTGIGMVNYVIIVILILVVVLLAIASLRKFETQPGSLPLRKLTIVAVITIAINAMTIAFIYREAIF